MAGTFGYEMNPALLSSEEKEEIRTQLATYRRHQELIREGDYYRLSDPFKEDVAAWMSVAKDQSPREELSSFRLPNQPSSMTTISMPSSAACFARSTIVSPSKSK